MTKIQNLQQLFSFIGKNLTRRPGAFMLTLIAVTAAVAGTFLLFSLRSAVTQTILGADPTESRLVEVTVYGASSSPFLKIFGTGTTPPTLSEATLIELQHLPGVQRASPQLVYQNLASVELEIGGQNIQTDTLIFGVTNEMEDWPVWGKDDPIPILISQKLIDFYNLSFAPGAGLPALSPGTFRGKEVEILPGFSSFLGGQKPAPSHRLRGKIIGFSDRVDLVGITIPLAVVKKMNEDEGRLATSYQKIMLRLDSPQKVAETQKLLEQRGLRSTSFQSEFQEVGRLLRGFHQLLAVLTGIILILAALLIATVFWSQLLGRRSEFALLKALGATRTTNVFITVCEMVISILIGGILGTILWQIVNSKMLLTGFFVDV